MDQPDPSREQERLRQARQDGVPWRKWGPYLSERQWGTVREDYSDDGDAWNYFPHDQARSRAYRWGEDGLAGLLRRPAAALLRARAVERAGPDPQGAAVRPDQRRGQPRRGRQGVLLLPRRHADALVHEVCSTSTRRRRSRTTTWSQTNRARGRQRAGVRAARHRRLRRGPLLRRRRRVRQGGAGGHPDPDHACTNRGPDAAELHLLPTLWFRNTWSWRRRTDRGRGCERAATRRGARAVVRRSTPSWATCYLLLRAASRRCCSPRTRPTTQRLVRHARTPRPTSRTASTTTSCAAAARR